MSKSLTKKSKDDYSFLDNFKGMDVLTVVNSILILGVVIKMSDSGEEDTKKNKNNDKTEKKREDCERINENLNILNMFFKRFVFKSTKEHRELNQRIEKLEKKLEMLESQKNLL